MRKLTSFFLSILLASTLTVSSVFAQSGSDLEFDAVAYRLDGSKAQIELYYGVIYRALNFKKSAKGFTAAIQARAEIRENGKVVASQDISKDVNFGGSRSELDQSGAMKVLDGAIFTVPYSDKLEAVLVWKHTDPNGKMSEVNRQVELSVPKPDNNFGIGGLELASDVKPADAANKSPFERVGYVVTPNPSLVYGDLYTTLYYYTEIYAPEKAVDPNKTVEVITRILDSKGLQMYTNTRNEKLAFGVIPVIGTVAIDGLPTDRYTLEVSIKHNGNLEGVTKKPFFYDSGIEFAGEEEAISTEGANEEASFMSSEITRISETELEEKIAQAKVVMEEKHIQLMDEAGTSDEKRRSLYAYWRARDGEAKPMTAYYKYYARVAEVEKKYRIMKTPGWKTDRGRIVLKYGEPADEKFEGHTIGTRPYIIWDYTPLRVKLTSGTAAEFVFVDRQGGGNFVLVHSNVLGEVSNPDWYNQDAVQMR
ncbi:MAG TPA: GWxTD domain-containing protein [Candidatus Kapabacteria bacterium]|nr:GWxTD domain-containing protein [Candidatus Kapabacteria bacterium]